MRRKTLMLFQLFLGVFAGYAVMFEVPNQYLVVPLFCLVCMFFLGRHRVAAQESEQVNVVADA